MKNKIVLKIGRKVYEISDEDVFMDNKACIQILSQNKEGSFPQLGKVALLLTKKAIKQINKYDRIPRKNRYGSDVEIFSLKI